MKSKYAWEMQIRKLGGPDYSAQRSGDVDGMALPGGGSYRYFGAAKNLPGVRELFETETPDSKIKEKTREELLTFIEPDYYGWRDEELEPTLLADELEHEQLLKEKMDVHVRDNPIPVRKTGELKGDLTELERALLEKKRKLLLEKYGASQDT